MWNLATTAASIFLTSLSGAAAPSTLTGEYVEARTCSVYTGACHANGELVTMGREALLAWKVKSGVVNGVRLDGLSAVAVVVADENLSRKDAARKSVLYVDSSATEAQRNALAEALAARYGASLGTVAAVKSAPVEFRNSGLEYTVRVPGSAYLRTTRYACNHCVMPHSTWYEPFVGLKSSIVAMASVNEFKGAPELGVSWKRMAENSSFVGEFAF
jgi:hypothetical protein